MEKYTINGHEFEYDTFDLVNIELMGNEFERIKEEGQKSSGLMSFRNMCKSVMDMFDLLIGEGTSKIAFGDRINVKEVLEAFASFSKEVTEAINGIGSDLKKSVETPAMNREQRRAEEREKKRAEAKARVESRGR